MFLVYKRTPVVRSESIMHNFKCVCVCVCVCERERERERQKERNTRVCKRVNLLGLSSRPYSGHIFPVLVLLV